MTRIEKMALERAREILACWWYEDQGEFQDEYDLTDEEMEQLNSFYQKSIDVITVTK